MLRTLLIILCEWETADCTEFGKTEFCLFSYLYSSREGGHVSVLAPKETKSVGQSAVSIKPTAPVHIMVQEKINLLADRNGGVEQFEVRLCQLNVSYCVTFHTFR